MSTTFAANKRYRQRHYSNPSPHNNCVGQGVVIPDDVVVLTRDPSPCFACGVAGACRHRPWEMVA